MKICHIITRMIVGGAQENTLFSCRGAKEAGHECVLVTGPSPGPEGELLSHAGGLDGLEVIQCPYLVREISPVNDLKAYFFLRDLIRRRGFDVVHTHSSKAGILGRLAARSAHARLIVHTIHGLAFHRYEKPWKNAAYIASEKLAARVSDRIYAVAQAMIEQSLQAGVGHRDMYKVVYSGMDLHRFLKTRPDPGLRRSLGIPDDAQVVGTVARLFEMKGYEDLFRMAPALVKACPKLHFLIVGDGNMRESLRQIAERDGFLDRISFAGLVPPSEVCRYTALMDVLVHFSLREGLPRAAVQALASSVPVVAYALDGTPEVVLDQHTGRLIQPGDTASAESAVIDLLNSDSRRREMGQAGRDLVSRLFDWHRMSGILLEDYQNTLSAKYPPRVEIPKS